MQQQPCKQCRTLMNQFTSYREKVLVEKEQMKKEIEKTKQTLEKFMNKMDKRIDARLKEDKNMNNQRLQELEEQHQVDMEKLRGVLGQKDRVIEEMRQLLRMIQHQKRQLIENNTKVLVQISQGVENRGQKGSEVMDSSYKELLRMYQFLIDENNDLKKEIYHLKKSNFTGSIANKNESSILEKSLNQSDYRPKSLVESSKGEAVTSTKNQTHKDKPKDKIKKVTSTKATKK